MQWFEAGIVSEYKSRPNQCTHAFHRTDFIESDTHVLDRSVAATQMQPTSNRSLLLPPRIVFSFLGVSYYASNGGYLWWLQLDHVSASALNSS